MSIQSKVVPLLNVAVLVLALVLGGMTIYRQFSAPELPARGDLTNLSRKYGTVPRELMGRDVFADTAVQLGGRRFSPLVLYHFATTCGACKINAGAWDSLAESVSAIATPVLMSWEDNDVLREHFGQQPANFRVVRISRETDAWARDEYALYATPVTYVFAPDGRFMFHNVGVFQRGAMDDLIAAVEVARKSKE